MALNLTISLLPLAGVYGAKGSGDLALWLMQKALAKTQHRKRNNGRVGGALQLGVSLYLSRNRSARCAKIESCCGRPQRRRHVGNWAMRSAMSIAAHVNATQERCIATWNDAYLAQCLRDQMQF